MKKLFFCLFVMVLLLAGCTEAEDRSVLEFSSVSIRKTDDGYAAYAVPDGSLLGVYTDYRAMRYFVPDGSIAVSHVLVGWSDGVTLSRVTEHGTEMLTDRFTSVSFFEDYIVADGFLFDGNLQKIELSVGTPVAVAPLEEGGMVTLSDADGVIRTCFPLFSSADSEPAASCLMLGGESFVLPDVISSEILSIAYPDAETAAILYRDADSSLRVLKITPIRYGGESVSYVSGIDSPAVPAEPTEYPGRYAAFVSQESASVPWLETTWLQDDAGNFTALCGTLTEAGGGTMLLRGAAGAAYIDTYFVYDRDLQTVSVLEDAVVLDGGDILGKVQAEESLVRYGANGEEIFRLPFERVWTVSRGGAAVCVGGQLWFTDTAGELLAAADGYRESMIFDEQMTRMADDSGAPCVVFDDPETGDPVEFRYEAK